MAHQQDDAWGHSIARIQYRPIVRGDMRSVVELLLKLRPSIAGLSSELMYQAILGDALTWKRVICLVAVRQEKPIGYVLAARDWRRFQRAFVLRHPMLGFRVLLKRLRSGLMRGKAEARDGPEPPDQSSNAAPAGTRNWGDSSPDIAKIIHIGTDGAERSKGVGSGLYAALYTHLERIGVTRVDAKIEEGNAASVRLHQRSGWTVAQCPGGFFATIDLPMETNERT
ncbi:MAG: GNAT family N-acetyltransferase [Pseudomonadota bacterium]